MRNEPLPLLPSIRFTLCEIDRRAVNSFGRIYEAGTLHLRAVVPDRDQQRHVPPPWAEHGGTERELKFSAILPPHWDELTPDRQAGWLRSRLLDFIAHEIDEMFYVAGLAPDPHKPKQYEPIVLPDLKLGRP